MNATTSGPGNSSAWKPGTPAGVEKRGNTGNNLPVQNADPAKLGEEHNSSGDHFLLLAQIGPTREYSQNFSKAWDCYEKAYKLKNPAATFNLACFYNQGLDRDGKWVGRDFKKALQLFKEADKLGDINASHTLSCLKEAESKQN